MGKITVVDRKPAITVCANCKYFVCEGKRKIWYNSYCHHPKWEKVIEIQDPVSGMWEYEVENEYGHKVRRETPYPYCRDLNEGDCDLYEESLKGTLSKAIEQVIKS